MAYNSPHTGPEIDAAVRMLGQVQSARDATGSDLTEVKTLSVQVDGQASQVATQAEVVSAKSVQIEQQAAAVELAWIESTEASAMAVASRDVAVQSAEAAQASRDAAIASEEAASQSQLAAGLSELIVVENATLIKELAPQVAANSEAAELSAQIAARSAQDAVAVVTGGTAALAPEPGKIPLASAQGTIDPEWLGPEIARSESIVQVTNAFGAISESVKVATETIEITAAALAAIGDPVNPAKGAALIPYDETTVGDQILLSRKVESYAAARAYLGSAAKVEVTESGLFGRFNRRLFKEGDVDDGGITLVSPDRKWTLEREFTGNVLASWFGAVGDGIRNDTQAVRIACRIATRLGRDVDFDGLKRVFIDTNADIRFNCSLRGRGATLVSRGGIITPPSHSTLKTMFRLADDSLGQRDISIDVAELYEGQTQLTVPESIGNGLLFVSSNKQIGSRTSDPTTPLYFAIPHAINRGGVLNYPIKTDLTAATIACKFTPSPQSWVEIEGFTADETSYNNQCLLRCERGLVKVRNIAIQPNGKNTMPASVNYLFRFLSGVNIVLEDMIINGQSTYGGSTYGIVFDNCCDIVMRSLHGRGRDTWGVMETNNVNGVEIIDCHMNRFDVHQGMHNFFVYGGVSYGNAVQYGWGTGLLVVEGLTVIGNTSVVAARNDYDGGFDGAIRIRQCNINYMRQTPNALTGVAELVAIFTANSLGGAFPIKMAESIEVSDICCIHAGSADVVLVKAIQFELASDSYSVAMPNVLMIKNIYSTKGRLLFTISCPWDKLKAPSSGKLNALIEDVDSKPYPAKATLMRTISTGNYASPPGTFRFKFRNVKGLTQYFGAPGARIAVEDSSVSHMKSFVGGGPAQRIELSNCDFEDTTSALNGNTIGELADASSEVIMNGVRIRSQANLEFADAMQGVLIKKGVSVKLPALATAVTAFTGYRDADLFV